MTDVCAKSNYDRLRIDKALGVLKSNSTNKKNKKKTFIVIREPSEFNIN